MFKVQKLVSLSLNKQSLDLSVLNLISEYIPSTCGIHGPVQSRIPSLSSSDRRLLEICQLALFEDQEPQIWVISDH